MQNQDFDLRKLIDLPNTGETPGQKVCLLVSSAPKQTSRLVQSSFANVHLMNARLGFAWAVAGVMYLSYSSQNKVDGC